MMPPRTPERLWAALCLPDLALECRVRGVEEPGALVVLDGPSRAPRVHACSQQATRLGVQPGMTLSAALSVAGDLGTLVRDDALERETLDGLAEWAYQFSSLVTLSTTEPWTLLIEVGGSLRLLADSAQAIGRRMRAELRELGFEARVAMAPTPLAAEWLARCGIQTLVRDPERLRRRLAALPVAVLTDQAEALEALTGIGVRTVGELARLPRAETTRRLRLALHHEVERALGRVSDPRQPHPRRERPTRSLLLPVPVNAVEALLFALGRLFRELMGVLVSTGAAVQSVVVRLDYSDRGHETLTLQLMAPSRDVRHLLELARHRLESLRLADSVERLGIEVSEQVDLAPRTPDLFDTGEVSMRGERADEWLTVLERLGARMGGERIRGLAPVGDHRPEHAWRRVAPGETTPGCAGHIPAGRRPLWLLPRPEPLQTANGVPVCRGPLDLLSAPERIESGWWDEQDVRRDYHVAVNAAGERYWVFRDLAAGSRWYLHGIFA